MNNGLSLSADVARAARDRTREGRPLEGPLVIVLTRHAEMRYARRIRSDIALSAVAAQGRIQYAPPGILVVAQTADAYLIHGDAVFPLQRRGDEWVAVTCIKRRRLGKADRRARRELAHAAWIEAA